MSKDRTDKHFVLLRRKIVASAKIRGLSAEETVNFLTEKELVNPSSGEPFSIATIYDDLKFIEEAWQREMLSSVGTHRARVMAELGEVKASAWKTGKLNIVLQALEKEVSLLGLNELERIGTEIALANLLRGLPDKLASSVKNMLTERLAQKKVDKLKLVGGGAR